MLLLTTKWRSSSIMTILTLTVLELWFLKDWKMVFPVLSMHLLINCSTKAFKIKICFTDDKMEVKSDIADFHFHCSSVMVLVILKNARTRININKSGLLLLWQPLVNNLEYISIKIIRVFLNMHEKQFSILLEAFYSWMKSLGSLILYLSLPYCLNFRFLEILLFLLVLLLIYWENIVLSWFCQSTCQSLENLFSSVSIFVGCWKLAYSWIFDFTNNDVFTVSSFLPPLVNLLPIKSIFFVLKLYCWLLY